MDDSFSRALSELETFSGFPSERLTPEGLVGAGADLRLFDAALTSGGDERIAPDANGRNRYGVPVGRSPGEVWFSSSTASAVSTRGQAAALAAFQRMADAGAHADVMSAWFDRIRERLIGQVGLPGTAAILSASGTEAELIVRVLAGNLLPSAFTSVVVAPTETGSGVPLAAEGRHFLRSAPFAHEVPRGQLLQGLAATAAAVEAIAIRDPSGDALPVEIIDDEVVTSVETAIGHDRCALLHVLDCSKTNRGGPSRATALALRERYGERLLVVVDACQLRCTWDQIRRDLAAGFVVMVTGSKFAGGPPFSGAILLPPQIVDRLRPLALPPGLFAYSAANDWPAELRSALDAPLAVPANVGLGLRWEAALSELEALAALAPGLRERVAARFAEIVRQHVGSCAALELLDDQAAAATPSQTIFPIVTRASSLISAERLHRALRAPMTADPAECRGRVYHVGQPVAVGYRSALRVCLSAPHIIAVGEAVRAGHTFDEAFAPLAADLNALFLKWLYLASRDEQPGEALLTA